MEVLVELVEVVVEDVVVGPKWGPNTRAPPPEALGEAPEQFNWGQKGYSQEFVFPSF